MAAPPPILLLPVRIETRFTAPSKATVQMLLRVFPDDVHVDTHERDLTQAESSWGDAFWTQFDSGTKIEAWIRLAHRFGPRRAAWIARVRKPSAPPLGPPVTVGARAESWTRAPFTNVLPDHWTVTGYSATGARLFSQDGSPITDPIPTGPSPHGTVSGGRTPPIDDGMLWMTDYSTAVANGMAVTVNLTLDQRKQLDRVMVFGWRAADATGALGDLFQAHQYTRGMSFLQAGSSTSNADVSSAFDSKAGFDQATLDLDTVVPRTLSADSDGHVAAAAFALDDAIFARVAGADNTQDANARAMNVALWAATGGYFLEQMMAGAFAYTKSAADEVRAHFRDYVRALGPLPTLRIGEQPYGVLPVMSFSKWSSTDPVLATMARFVRALQPAWAASEAAVAADPQQQLLDIVTQEGVSIAYSARAVFGPGYGDYLWQFLGRGDINSTWWATQKKAVTPVLNLLGLPSDPLISRALFADQSSGVDAPLVCGSPVPAGAGLGAAFDYLTWLRSGASGYLDIKGRTKLAPDLAPTPLLYLLARHSALREYASATYAYPPGSPGPHFDRELVRVRPGTETTIWDQLAINGAALDQARTGAPIDPTLVGFREFFDSLQHLAALPISTLELLFASTLDLFTNRLDSWITAFATRRLKDLRTAQPTGILVGGYGWVEGLGKTVPAGDQAGFIHAPSLTQAVTAAIMRSANRSNAGSASPEVLSVNLSSEAVRQGMTILDAVRQGQSPGAVLGYLFERWLHEATGLDQYVDVFRTIASSGDLRRAENAWNAASRADAAATAAFKASSATAQAAADDAAAKLAALGAAQSSLQAASNQLAADQRQSAELGALIGIFAGLIAAERAQGLTPTTGQLTALATFEMQKGVLDAPNGPIAQLAAQINTLQTVTIPAAQKASDDANTAAANAARDLATVTDAMNAADAALAVALAEFERIKQSLIDSYQLTEGATTDSVATAVESLGSPVVVDGVALDRLNTTNSIPWGWQGPDGAPLPKPDPKNADYARLVKQLERLHDAVRSISDLLAAESVFQTVRGNPHRAAATLDAIGKGLATPPELEVVRTPRTGATMTERLIVLFAGAPPALTAWASSSPRAAAEPWLNYWAGTSIGDPASVVCQANYLDASGNVTKPTTVSFKDLGLAPLDVIQMSDCNLGDPASEMRQRLALVVAPPTPPAVSVQFIFDRPPPDPHGKSPQQVGFSEALELARVLRALTHFRAATANDLVPPGQVGGDGVDVAEIEARATAAKAALKAVLGNLTAGAGARAALLAAASFGVPGALPPPSVTDPLDAQLEAVKALVQGRLDNAGIAAPTGVDDAVRQLQAVFGGDFTVLPRFTPANASEITTALTASDVTQGNDGLQADTWVEQLSWVRDGPRRLQRLLAYLDGLANPNAGFQVVQLPYVPNAVWGALQGGAAPGGSVGLVIHAPAGTKLSGEAAGLLIDELVEVIPSAAENTGIAFQFEHPASHAPQALLLAVPTDDQAWSAATLETTLLETIALVEQVRPVDPDSLKGVGQFFPALYFALNLGSDGKGTDPDTVSTDFWGAGALVGSG